MFRASAIETETFARTDLTCMKICDISPYILANEFVLNYE